MMTLRSFTSQIFKKKKNIGNIFALYITTKSLCLHYFSVMLSPDMQNARREKEELKLLLETMIRGWFNVTGDGVLSN